MNNKEMILLAWYKGSKNSPWVLSLEDNSGEKQEVTIGEGGSAAAGPRFSEALTYINKNTYRFPVNYDMRQTKSKLARTVTVKTVDNKVIYIESSTLLIHEIKSSFYQTPFTPQKEKLTYINDSRYIESATTENKIISTMSSFGGSTRLKQTKKSATLLTEYVENTNVFWIFIEPQNIDIKTSNQIEGYVSAYNWPEGYIVPDRIGNQKITDSQSTVTIDLLGLAPFSQSTLEPKEHAIAYGLYGKSPLNGPYYTQVFSKIDNEAKGYLTGFTETNNIVAVSLQYSKKENKVIAHNNNLLGVAYLTDFKSLSEVENSIRNENFRAINLNKSLLKEKYSSNDYVRENNPSSKDLPIVEYLNQTKEYEQVGINPARWIDEVGISEPPTYKQDAIYEEKYEESVKKEEEAIESIVEETVKKDIEDNLSRKSHYIEGYVNNDISYVPAKDDRLESGELYSQVYLEDEEQTAGALPYDYTHKVRIGDSIFEIPPLSIRADKEQANESVPTMRSRNAMQKGIGTTRQVLTLELYFHDLENINGHKYYAYTKENGEEVYYYMDGLRSLLAQFMRTPFVPIDNDYINNTLGIQNVAMRDIQATTVEGFPEALSVTLVLEEVDLGAYLMGITNLGSIINYPLFRWYYQQSLHRPLTEFNKNTYLPKIKNLDNTFKFRLADEEYLNNRVNIIKEFNRMRKPRDYKKTIEERKAKEASEENENTIKKTKKEQSSSRSALLAIESYEKYQEYYGNLPKKIKEKYSPGNFPVMTHTGIEQNLKHGEIVKIPKDEYEIGLEAGRAIYGDIVNSSAMNSIVYKVANNQWVKNKIAISEKDAYFLPGYQIKRVSPYKEMIDSGVPGFLQIKIEDGTLQRKFRRKLRSSLQKGNQDYRNYEYSQDKFYSSTFLIPAGTVDGVDFLSMVRNLAGDSAVEVQEELDAYTTKYNQLAEIVNSSEEDIPMHEITIDELIPLSVNVGISNNLSLVQTQTGETPSLQYLGGQQPEIQLTFSTTDEGAKQIDDLFRKVGSYAKKYRVGMVTNFMEIENSLVNLFGIKSVLPNVFQINTVDGQPNEKIVTLIFVGFDKTQRRQEAINQFAGGKATKELYDLHASGFDPEVNALYVDEKIKNMELYPDLELPTYKELEEDIEFLGSGVQKIENRREQVFLDPDFYVSTQTTVRKELNELLSDKRTGSVHYKDDLGLEAESNPLDNKGMSLTKDVVDKINKIDEENDFVDPYLEWKGYEDEEDDSRNYNNRVEAALRGATTEGDMLDIKKNKVNLIKPSKETMNKWGMDGTNPNSMDVYNHLRNEVIRIFGEEEGITNEEVLKKDWKSIIWNDLKQAVKEGVGASFGNPNIDDAQIQKELDAYVRGEGPHPNDIEREEEESLNYIEQINKDTPKILNKKELNLIKASPTEYFSAAIDVAGFFHPDLLGNYEPMYLENGIHEIIKPEENFEVRVDTPFSENSWELSSIDTSNKDVIKHKAHDNKYNIEGMPLLRVFMYMKTLIEVESGWKQFDEEGNVLINQQNKEDYPFKVGIMGALLSKSENQQEAQRLAWDWKYNITFSLEKMREIYTRALNNPYYDFHLRRLDWAIASHSGMAMPPILHSRASQHDMPYTKDKLLIAPESLFYFSQFGYSYARENLSMNEHNPLQLYMTPDGVNKEIMAKDMDITMSEVDELIDEFYLTESNNTDQYDLEEKIRHMYVSMQQYNHVGRLVRAFPSFTMMLIDEGKWFQNFRTWDNFYGYNSLNSIDVYKSRKIAADTAVISMSNMYGNLSSSEGQPGPDLPSFFSVQFWDHYVLGKPTDEQIETRAEIYDQMMLQTGARVHLRIGYGSDATALPVVFNGSIAEMTSGEVVEITAQSDALELQNVISGNPKDDNVGFLNRVQEPRRTIGELMTSKGNWLKDMVNDKTNSYVFKDVSSGIVHFGSTIDSELGNRAILPGENREEFGESLQNVYSQNGMEVKSQWRNSDGSRITRTDMALKHGKSLITEFGKGIFGNTAAFDEANIAVSYYGRTVWDVIQTFALASQDYVATVEPFEYRSTLFFGKPHWMMQYRYDSDFIYDSDRKKIDRTVTKAHIRTFMQAHVYSSTHNIITNNIMVSEDNVYNNVVVTYDGRQAGPIQADSDIRMDKQRTVNVEANLLAPRLIEYYRAEDQALIYGQSALRDFMKDMYKGQYTIIGDPAITPYDVVYMNDIVSDIHGIHLVKAVHHSMSAEHGYITNVEPDAYIYNFDEEMGQIPGSINNIGKNLNMSVSAKAIDAFSGSVIAGSVIAKLVQVIPWGYAPSLFTGLTLPVSPIVTSGVNTYAISQSLKTASTLVSQGGQSYQLAQAINSAKTLEEVQTAVNIAGNALAKEVAISSTATTATAGELALIKSVNEALLSGGKNVSTAKTMKTVGSSMKNLGQLAKGVVTSKMFILNVALVGFEISTAWIGEWWNRKKQNAEAIKVVPLIHKGNRWTALMNWHKGSVLGDDPSLKDKLMNAEFFDSNLDPEVKEVFGNTLFKILNTLG